MRLSLKITFSMYRSLEKLVVGNIHEKKFVIKKFCLSWLQTTVFICGKKIFVCLIFVYPALDHNFFPPNFSQTTIYVTMCVHNVNLDLSGLR